MLSLVAKTVKNDEERRTHAVQNAVDDEWRNLSGRTCWDESQVFEYDDIRHKALKEGKQHFGRVFHVCTERHQSLSCSSGSTREEWSSKEAR